MRPCAHLKITMSPLAPQAKQAEKDFADDSKVALHAARQQRLEQIEASGKSIHDYAHYIRWGDCPPHSVSEQIDVIIFQCCCELNACDPSVVKMFESMSRPILDDDPGAVDVKVMLAHASNMSSEDCENFGRWLKSRFRVKYNHSTTNLETAIQSLSVTLGTHPADFCRRIQCQQAV